MGARYSCVKAESSHLGEIHRRRDTFFSTPNGTFLWDKWFDIELNFTEFSKSRIIAWEFHVLTEKQKLLYHVIIDLYLMK